MSRERTLYTNVGDFVECTLSTAFQDSESEMAHLFQQTQKKGVRIRAWKAVIRDLWTAVIKKLRKKLRNLAKKFKKIKSSSEVMEMFSQQRQQQDSSKKTATKVLSALEKPKGKFKDKKTKKVKTKKAKKTLSHQSLPTTRKKDEIEEFVEKCIENPQANSLIKLERVKIGENTYFAKEGKFTNSKKLIQNFTNSLNTTLQFSVTLPDKPEQKQQVKIEIKRPKPQENAQNAQSQPPQTTMQFSSSSDQNKPSSSSSTSPQRTVVTCYVDITPCNDDSANSTLKQKIEANLTVLEKMGITQIDISEHLQEKDEAKRKAAKKLIEISKEMGFELVKEQNKQFVKATDEELKLIIAQPTSKLENPNKHNTIRPYEPFQSIG